MYNWSTLKKLIWLYAAKLKGGASAIIETITGNLPLVLQNAIQHSINSLTRYGLCTQDGTPTPADPVPIKCNNGELKWDSENQRIYADGTPEVLTVRPGEHLVLSASDFTQVDAGKVETADFISVQPGTDYVYAFDMVDTVSGVKYETDFETYDADGNRLRKSGFGNTNGCRSGQFTADSNEVKVKVNIHCKSSSDTMTPSDIVSFAFDAQSTSYDPAGKNLFNRLNCVYGMYLNGSGNPTSNSTPSCYSCPIPVDSNKTYTFSGISSNVGNNNKRVCFYKADDSFISAQASAVTNADVPYSVTFTPPENTAYCRLSLNTADTEVMLEEGSTQTAYEPYIDASWQTASVPMLLSVGDVKDEVELIHGTLTRRVTACLYDGTQPVGDVYMSTTGGKDAGAIIIYPLATPTTEQITGQNLVTNEGTNVVDSVANVSPLEAKVKYMTASAQDVLSTLLGMKVTKQDISTQDAEDIIDIITGEDNK